MDQDELKVSDFGKSLGHCFKIQSIDLGGCRAIGDDFFNNLANGEIKEEGVTVKPGFVELTTLKVNYLTRIMDGSVSKICSISPVLEHLELTGCENLTDYAIESIFKTYRNIQFIDINHIPVVTPAFYEILKGHRPELMVRRYQFTEVDPKDNMLRVPLRIAEKKGKKGKKKKKKK